MLGSSSTSQGGVGDSDPLLGEPYAPLWSAHRRGLAWGREGVLTNPASLHGPCIVRINFCYFFALLRLEWA